MQLLALSSFVVSVEVAVALSALWALSLSLLSLSLSSSASPSHCRVLFLKSVACAVDIVFAVFAADRHHCQTSYYRDHISLVVNVLADKGNKKCCRRRSSL